MKICADPLVRKIEIQAMAGTGSASIFSMARTRTCYTPSLGKRPASELVDVVDISSDDGLSLEERVEELERELARQSAWTRSRVFRLESKVADLQDRLQSTEQQVVRLRDSLDDVVCCKICKDAGSLQGENGATDSTELFILKDCGHGKFCKQCLDRLVPTKQRSKLACPLCTRHFRRKDVVRAFV